MDFGSYYGTETNILKEVFIMNDMRYIRKAAFAVGFGLTMGKFVGKCVIAGINGAVTGINRAMAKNGNKFAQEFCDKADIKYETNEDS